MLQMSTEYASTIHPWCAVDVRPGDTKAPSQYKECLSMYGNFNYTDPTVVRPLIFIMEIPIPVRRHLDTEAGP